MGWGLAARPMVAVVMKLGSLLGPVRRAATPWGILLPSRAIRSAFRNTIGSYCWLVFESLSAITTRRSVATRSPSITIQACRPPLHHISPELCFPGFEQWMVRPLGLDALACDRLHVDPHLATSAGAVCSGSVGCGSRMLTTFARSMPYSLISAFSLSSNSISICRPAAA